MKKHIELAIEELVHLFPSKHKNGLTLEETIELLSKFPAINKNSFFKEILKIPSSTIHLDKIVLKRHVISKEIYKLHSKNKTGLIIFYD